MTIKCINGPMPYQTNTFLIIDGDVAAVIDPAAEPSLYLDEIKKTNAKLKYIFLTHGHHDHIFAVEALREQTGARLYMHPSDRQISKLKEDYQYEENSAILLNTQQIIPVFTPGHTQGSVCLKLDDMCFTGDTVFKGNVGRTDLVGGDEKMLKVSLKHLFSELKEDTRLFPGHGDFTDYAYEKSNNYYVKNVL